MRIVYSKLLILSLQIIIRCVPCVPLHISTIAWPWMRIVYSKLLMLTFQSNYFPYSSIYTNSDKQSMLTEQSWVFRVHTSLISPIFFCVFVVFFFVFWFAFSTIHGSGRTAKKKQGRPITWMASGGCEMGVGGRGPRSNKALDFIIKRSNDSQDPRRSQDWQYSTSPVRNSFYRYCTRVCSWAPPPYTSTRRHSSDKCSQVFPHFPPLFHFHVLYWTQIERTKNGGGLPLVND